MYFGYLEKIYKKYISCVHNKKYFTLRLLTNQVKGVLNMEILTIACACFVVFNIHAYCMPIKNKVELLEKELVKIPFSDEDIARTL